MAKGTVYLDSTTQREWLLAELHLLHLGQFYLNGFQRLASGKVALPGEYYNTWSPGIDFNMSHLLEIKYHVQNSFLADITSHKHPDYSSVDGPKVWDTHPLPVNHILVTPLLPTNGKDFLKFSGTDTAGNDQSPLGQALSAFAHYVFIQMQDTVFVDMQGTPWSLVIKEYNGRMAHVVLSIFQERTMNMVLFV